MIKGLYQNYKYVIMLYITILITIGGVVFVLSMDQEDKLDGCKKQCLENYKIFYDYNYSYRHNGTCTCINTNQLTIFDDG